MKILITGTSGFIGKNLISRLRYTDVEIWQIGRNLSQSSPDDKIINIDLADQAAMRAADDNVPLQFDACIHLAGQTDIAKSLDNPAGDINGNITSIINLLSILRFKKFIYISTGSVYEGQKGMVCHERSISPTIPYAISKYAGELYVRSFHKIQNNPESYTILRLFNPYGPFENSQRLLPRLIRQFGIDKCPDFNIKGTGKGLIDPMYVQDTVEALVKVLYSDVHNQEIDICSGEPVTIEKLVYTIASFFEIEPHVEFLGHSNEEITYYGNPSIQEKLVGFKPQISLRRGIDKYYKFLINGVQHEDTGS